MCFSECDRGHMRHALRLAERGRGRVSPNPPVGCVIARDERILGEGWHRRCGGPHAEANALAAAREAARGATAYVTLMPCAHAGRTPPCCRALIEAGISRVVAAMDDPNPVSKDGAAQLRAAGVRVEVGLLESEARELARGFLRHLETGLPFLTLKYAMSLDGRIATRTGASQWISGERSRAEVQRLRSRVDGVIVGIGTALADDPRLTVRLPDSPQPRRVVVDSDCRLPPTARLLGSAGGQVLVLAGETASTKRARELERAGALVLRLPLRAGRVDLDAAMRILARQGARELLCEGGATLAAGLFEQRLVQEIIVFLAPKILGGREAPGPVGGLGAASLAEALQLGRLRARPCGEDLHLSARVCYGGVGRTQGAPDNGA